MRTFGTRLWMRTDNTARASMISFALAQLSRKDPITENHIAENDRQHHHRAHQIPSNYGSACRPLRQEVKAREARLSQTRRLGPSAPRGMPEGAVLRNAWGSRISALARCLRLPSLID
jgi:hypothetical protein